MLCQTGDIIIHKRINACIISCGGQYQFAVTERIGQRQRHVIPCKIINHNFWTSFSAQFIGQNFHCFFRVAVYRSVGDYNSLCLRGIGRPCVIQSDVMSEIFSKHRSVERADGLNIQACRHL